MSDPLPTVHSTTAPARRRSRVVTRWRSPECLDFRTGTITRIAPSNQATRVTSRGPNGDDRWGEPRRSFSLPLRHTHRRHAPPASDGRQPRGSWCSNVRSPLATNARDHGCRAIRRRYRSVSAGAVSVSRRLDLRRHDGSTRAALGMRTLDVAAAWVEWVHSPAITTLEFSPVFLISPLHDLPQGRDHQ